MIKLGNTGTSLSSTMDISSSTSIYIYIYTHVYMGLYCDGKYRVKNKNKTYNYWIILRKTTYITYMCMNIHTHAHTLNYICKYVQPGDDWPPIHHPFQTHTHKLENQMKKHSPFASSLKPPSKHIQTKSKANNNDNRPIWTTIVSVWFISSYNS